MSILIKGMEMPKSCCECPVNMNICKRGYEYLLEHTELYDQRADDCPISYVPPHGDLIDRDALLKSQHGVYFLETLLPAVKNAPTIIPAEEGE